jgi:hypothetical protein
MRVCSAAKAVRIWKKTVSKRMVLVTDKLAHCWVKQGFMPVMKPLVYPLFTGDRADMGKAHAFLGGDAL